MKIRLRHKVIGLAIFSALIPVIALSYMVLGQQKQVVKDFNTELETLVDRDLNDILSDVKNLCITSNELIERQVNANLRVAVRMIEDLGGIRMTDKPILWKAENEFSGEREDVYLKQLVFGDVKLEQNYRADIKSSIVDDMGGVLGCTVSVFQRMNERGDMMRVATNLLRGDGSRDVGQYLPAYSKEHDPQNAIARVLKGETVYSTVYFIDQWFIFAAAPLRESKTGEIVGMIRTAISQNSLDLIENALNKVMQEHDGFAWVMQGKNRPSQSSRVRFIYPNRSSENYFKLNKVIQDNGSTFFETVRNYALSMDTQSIFTERYEIDKTEQGILKYVYFPEWDWVIGVATAEKDFTGMYAQLSEPFSALMQSTLWAGLFGLIIVLMIAFILGDWITRPISKLTQVALKVADGDLNTAIQWVDKAAEGKEHAPGVGFGDDETGQLCDAIRRMILNLNSLIGQIRHATVELIASAAHLTDTSKVQEKDTIHFEESTQQIASAVEAISETSQDLVSTMQGVSDIAMESGSIADEGRTQITEMESTIQQLAQATASVSERLTVIKEKASNINSIVTTISKVADQTNLLSVNAAIEAEKAREYGQGFAVVAREIGRLSDQTALAASDIEQMVREMHAAISTAVVDMDDFTKEVLHGVREMGRASTNLEDIIQQVQTLSPQFELVNEGVQSQSKGATEINHAMVSLAGVAHRSSDSLKYFDQARLSLEKAIQGLQLEVSRFEVSDLETLAKGP